MNKLTASNIVSFINQLDKKATYNYLDPRNKGLIQIVEVELPEGPSELKDGILQKTKKQQIKRLSLFLLN
jgi:type II restriction enzyme